jgi:hypothetical protein
MDNTLQRMEKSERGPPPVWKTIHVFSGGSSESTSSGNHNLPQKYVNKRLWHSQYLQDMSVIRAFMISGQRPEKRFFVDLAAHDATQMSNTKSLEDQYGWTGLCVEGNAEFMHSLSHRECTVVWAVVADVTGRNFEFVGHPNGNEDGGLGGIVSNETDNKFTTKGKRKNITAVSLIDILDNFHAPKVIDYLSLDVEGAEDLVLSPKVLQAYTFLTMTIERPSKKLKSLLKRMHYMYVRDHGKFGDAMFIHKSLPNAQAVQRALRAL